MAVVLLVEGDYNLRQAGHDYLAGKGHSVVGASSAAEGLRALRQITPDIIVLNADLQDMSVDEFHYWLRANPQYASTPVIYLVHAGLRGLLEASMIAASEGKSIVLAKPFRWDDVEEKLRTILADPPPASNGASCRVGKLALCPQSYELKGEQGSVLLTPLEFRLANYLMERADTLVGVEELLERVWGYYPHTGSPDVVRAHMRNLRHKIGQVTQAQDAIQTVPRRGYRLVAEPTTSMYRAIQMPLLPFSAQTTTLAPTVGLPSA